MDSGNAQCEDDLTHKLMDVIKANMSLKQSIDSGEPKHKQEELDKLLQYHVATLFDNELNGQPRATQRGGRPLKTLRQRLKGKDGRIRGLSSRPTRTST